LVLECVPAPLAAKVSQALSISTIGIGAGNGCDGQVLVIHDVLGLLPGFKPKFVKAYRTLHTEITAAVQEYISEVKTRQFPGPEHSFAIADEVLEKLY
jgi:3-methyl-2-oxobutanoate hydroxymethyltransferase